MSDRTPGQNPFDPSFEQLPDTLPIFPLSGVLLLPGGKLPLNIFEPRYLAMVFEALAGLARYHVTAGDFEQATALLDQVPAKEKNHADVVAVKATIDLAAKAKEAGPIDELKAKAAADPKDFQSRLDLAMAYWAGGQKQEAIDELLAMIKADRNWNEAAARTQLLKFFEALGFADPLAVDGRKRLSTILFS